MENSLATKVGFTSLANGKTENKELILEVPKKTNQKKLGKPISFEFSGALNITLASAIAKDSLYYN